MRAAQNRKRGLSVLERLRADEDAAADAVDQAAVASARSRKQRKTVSAVEDVAVLERSGGMSMKTGMVLARAKLAESASGILVAQDRQAALVGKGAYREAEKVAREGPVGMLATKEMPNLAEGAEHAAFPVGVPQVDARFARRKGVLVQRALNLA